MTEQLNHHNPEYVTWKYEEILFALLGGIRIEGLHSMRGTLKVDFKTFPSIRHGLDLYNETQTEKLIKNIAERFTLSTTYIHKAIGNLINKVEDYRLQQIDSNKLKSTTNKPTLSKEEEQAAIQFLKTDNLSPLSVIRFNFRRCLRRRGYHRFVRRFDDSPPSGFQPTAHLTQSNGVANQKAVKLSHLKNFTVNHFSIMLPIC
jgi:predicted DNA-binding protein